MSYADVESLHGPAMKEKYRINLRLTDGIFIIHICCGNIFIFAKERAGVWSLKEQIKDFFSLTLCDI